MPRCAHLGFCPDAQNSEGPFYAPPHTRLKLEATPGPILLVARRPLNANSLQVASDQATDQAPDQATCQPTLEPTDQPTNHPAVLLGGRARYCRATGRFDATEDLTETDLLSVYTVPVQQTATAPAPAPVRGPPTALSFFTSAAPV